MSWRVLWVEEYPTRRRHRKKPDAYRFGVLVDGRCEPVKVVVQKGPDAVDRAKQAIELAVLDC